MPRKRWHETGTERRTRVYQKPVFGIRPVGPHAECSGGHGEAEVLIDDLPILYGIELDQKGMYYTGSS